MAEHAQAFAPASIGNLAVGFDMLGLALDAVGDRVEARRTPQAGVGIDSVHDRDGGTHGGLSKDPARNTASIAARSFWDTHGDGGGVMLTIRKGVPLKSGMGSSAASAVAAVVAVNGLLESPLPTTALLTHALAGETFASGGQHADNVAPSLFGGLVFCPELLLPDVIPLPVPDGVSAVLLHPDLAVDTAEARRGLAPQVPVARWLEQQACLGAFIAACAADDTALLGRVLRDVIIEPQRVAAVPCFDVVRDAAIGGGAYGCSLSGSGPSIFALVASAAAETLAAAMATACRKSGIDCETWVSSLTAPGARLED